MRTFTTHEAKTKLSQLIDLALAGQEVQIYRGKTPVVKLSPILKTKKKRIPGKFKGKIFMAPDFTAESEDFNKLYYGE